jgi:hypothetical protein
MERIQLDHPSAVLFKPISSSQLRIAVDAAGAHSTTGFLQARRVGI